MALISSLVDIVTDKGRDFLQIYDRIGNESEVQIDLSNY
jgi:hypothetical protein